MEAIRKLYFVQLCFLLESLMFFQVFSAEYHCDVIIAGGSTAALGAAIASARSGYNRGYSICLTEPTDWLGGQLTSSGVSAVDFGPLNRYWWFQSTLFEDMMNSLGSGNPGNCWVSTKCYIPTDLINGWINTTVSKLPGLKIFYNSVVKSVSRNGAEIESLDIIRRKPRPGVNQWAFLLSDVINDWYSTTDSAHFTKEVVRLRNFNSPHPPIIIDATELGDILVLSNSYYRQGVEAPTENSPTYDTCGQDFTFPFYIEFSNSRSNASLPVNSGGTYSFNGKPWGQIWSYRRSKYTPGPGYHAAHSGEISNQNWNNGNDYDEAYIFLPEAETYKQRNDWRGGVDVAALNKAEMRAYGWYHYYVSQAPNDTKPNLHIASSSVTGTETRLSKFPYIRDTRRSVGLFAFRLKKSDLDTPHQVGQNTNQRYDTSGPAPLSPSQYAKRFNDSIAIGNYLYADIHAIRNCEWPGYTNNHHILPYHIPFRALTNIDLSNLLVAGKTMAQSFMANAATRFHPVEFVTGEAAGTAAVIMAARRYSTTDMYKNVNLLQNELRKSMPIYWDEPRTLDSRVFG